MISSSKDIPALWAYQGLKVRGISPIEIVTGEALAYAPYIEHRLVDSRISTYFVLADGREIDSSTVSGTLNRLTYIPADHLKQVVSTDFSYAQEELYAFFLSWLYGLNGPVINKPNPQGLCGAWFHISQWFWLAQQAMLPTSPYKQTCTKLIPGFPSKDIVTQTVIVFNGNCYCSLTPRHIQEGCIHLAKLAKTSLLGVDFAKMNDGRWRFVGATPAPDLRLGGARLLDDLTEVLTS